MMALPHISVSLPARYLNRKLPCQWKGRGGPIAWPPGSPDLNRLDFYLWGHLKSLVYSSQWMMWKLSEIEFWQVFRQYATCRNLGSSSGGNETSSWGLYSGRRGT
jgi:hypothetical protein